MRLPTVVWLLGTGIYWNIRRTMDEFRVMIKNVIGDQRSTFDVNHQRGFIDKFLTEQHEKRGKYFTDDDLLICCQVSVSFSD